MKTLLNPLIVLSLILLVGCGKKKSLDTTKDHTTQAIEASEAFFDHPEEITLYNSNQPNADDIKKCVFVQTVEESCPFNKVPLIGVGKDKVTIDDILNRTMSSKASYIETFKKILQNMPPETLTMFGSVNAVVISERIVPSFYQRASGAIYLSSAYFWLTQEEKSLIKNKDFRGSFGSTLKFTDEAGYFKDGRTLKSKDSEKVRTVEDLQHYTARVLFHELSHANDFFPKSYYSANNMDATKTYFDLSTDIYNAKKVISDNFKTTLTSPVLIKLAAVLHRGEDADNYDLSVDAETVLKEFKNDVAADLYAYATPREDLAMLVERSLMYHYYQYSSYIVIIKFPTANFSIPENYEYPIIGGIRDKIADPKVKARAQYVLEKIFDADYSKKVMVSLDAITPFDYPDTANWDNLLTF